jgi:hypothetical protein
MLGYLCVVVEDLVSVFPPNSTHLVPSKRHASVKLIVSIHPARMVTEFRIIWELLRQNGHSVHISGGFSIYVVVFKLQKTYQTVPALIARERMLIVSTFLETIPHARPYSEAFALLMTCHQKILSNLYAL